MSCSWKKQDLKEVSPDYRLGVSEKEQKYHLDGGDPDSEDSLVVGLFPFAAWKCWWGRVERSPQSEPK